MKKVWTGSINCSSTYSPIIGTHPAVTYHMPPQLRTIRAYTAPIKHKPTLYHVAFPNTIFTVATATGCRFTGSMPAATPNIKVLFVNAIRENHFTPDARCYPFPFANTYNKGYTCLSESYLYDYTTEEMIATFFGSIFYSNTLLRPIHFQTGHECCTMQDWEMISKSSQKISS